MSNPGWLPEQVSLWEESGGELRLRAVSWLSNWSCDLYLDVVMGKSNCRHRAEPTHVPRPSQPCALAATLIHCPPSQNHLEPPLPIQTGGVGRVVVLILAVLVLCPFLQTALCWPLGSVVASISQQTAPPGAAAPASDLLQLVSSCTLVPPVLSLPVRLYQVI